MMPISDGVVIGVVLGLVFAAVSYYLYNRMTQLERTVSFMENILLDLKTTTEHTLLSATEPPEEMTEQEHQNSYIDTSAAVVSNGNDDAVSVSKSVQSVGNARELSVEQTPRARVSSQTIQVEREGSSQPSVSVNYEAMTYKELQQVVKQKGVPGTRNLSKAQVIELIRNFDAGISAVSSSSATSQSTTLSSWNLTSEEGKPIDQLSSGEDMGAQLIASFDDKPESSFVSSD
jgi:hypothetical protein